MSTTPYARLLVSLNGGAAAAGGVEAAASDDVDFVYESTVGWPAQPAPYLEIYEAPLNWAPVPSTGWIETDGGGWKYYGTTPPPAIAAPDAAHFGKVACQLVVGGGLKAGKLSADMTSGVTILVRSASVGLESTAARETTEFDPIRSWIGAIQRDLRLLEAALASGGGVPTSRTITAGAGLTGGGSLAADRTIAVATADASITVNADSIEASGNFVAKDIATTGAVAVTKSGITNTPTRGVTIVNATNSGTQWGAQFGWSAINGGAQLNAGFQFEPQSSSRFIVRCAHLVGGTGVPSSSGPYWDLSDPNLGNGWFSDVFGVKSGGAGLRFLNASNRGGLDQDGSSNNRLKSYSGPGFVVEMYSDAGSTLVATPISLAGTGKGRFVATVHTVTSTSNAVTMPLATSQEIRHTLTEDTTVTFSGAVAGQRGAIEFVQGNTGYTVTMPTSGSAVEYDAAIQALGYTSIVDTSTNKRTLLHYRVTDTPAGRVYIWHRSVSATIP